MIIKLRDWLAGAFLVCALAPAALAADSRADFLKLIDRPKVPLAAEAELKQATNGLSEYRFSFASEAGQRVPGILVEKTDGTGKRPVVILLHGTGGNKEGMLSLARTAARRGFVGVAIDAPYHGARKKSPKGTGDYDDAMFKAWQEQKLHPFFFDTVWDVMRLVDYLETREDVDSKRIGLMGISKGGIETYLTAAVDERIAAAVPCIGVESFLWALDHNLWQPRISTIQGGFNAAAKDAGVSKPDAAFTKKFYDHIAPGIYGEFDGPAMLPLIAPRALMTINGDTDERTPADGLKECTDAAQKAYHAANADDHFLVRIQEHTQHQVRPESERAAMDWFEKWLKP